MASHPRSQPRALRPVRRSGQGGATATSQVHKSPNRPVVFPSSLRERVPSPHAGGSVLTPSPLSFLQCGLGDDPHFPNHMRCPSRAWGLSPVLEPFCWPPAALRIKSTYRCSVRPRRSLKSVPGSLVELHSPQPPCVFSPIPSADLVFIH